MKGKMRHTHERAEWRKAFDEMLADVKKHNERVEKNNDNGRVSDNDNRNSG